MPSENKIEFMQGSPRPLWAAFALLLICCGLFLTLNVKGDWDFVLQLRLTKLAALLMVAYAVGVSTQLFQTLTNNPILTPSILGFDSLYVFLQTLLVFTFGGVGYASLPLTGKFGFELVVMMGGSLLLFYTLIKQGGRDLPRMILIGVIFGILFRSLSSLLSRMIDPEEFTAAQANMFAGFNLARTLPLGRTPFGARPSRQFGHQLHAQHLMDTALDCRAGGDGDRRGRPRKLFRASRRLACQPLFPIRAPFRPPADDGLCRRHPLGRRTDRIRTLLGHEGGIKRGGRICGRTRFPLSRFKTQKMTDAV